MQSALRRRPAPITPAAATSDGASIFLALQAGGVAGIGHMGAARVLHVLDAHYPIHTIVGTSAGSDAGAVIASGLPDDQAKEAVLNFPYADLEKRSWLQRLPVVGTVVGSAANLLLHQGIFDGDRIATDMGAVLAKAGIRVFQDYDKKVAAGVPHAAHLAVVAYDINKGMGATNWARMFTPQGWIAGAGLRLIAKTFVPQAGLVVFPRAYADEYGITDPAKQSVSLAIRASSAIPFVFTPAHIGGHILVDGGVAAMLPHTQAVELAKASGVASWRVINVALGGAGSAPSPAHDDLMAIPKELLQALRQEADAARDALLNDPVARRDTIVIDTAGISGTHFQLTRDQQLLLYDAGLVSAIQFAVDDNQIRLSLAELQELTTLAQTAKTELSGLLKVAQAGKGGLDVAATQRIDTAAAAVLARLRLGPPPPPRTVS